MVRIQKNPLESVFNPTSVAVIGASENPEKMGYQILKNIIDAGYKGKVLPINPKSSQILGLPTYATLNDAPTNVDLAVIVIPAPLVPGALADCVRKRTKGVVIISGGFSEIGRDGKVLEDSLRELARSGNMAIVGPNCQGINNPHIGLCATWPLIKRKGNIFVIAQSGTLGAAFSCLAEDEGLGISKCANLGNKMNQSEIDFMRYGREDSGTKVVALCIEGVSNGREFLKVALETAKTKPVVVLKGGRTAAGSRAVMSHTGALAGSDKVFDAAARQTCLVRARNFEELYDSAKALSLLPLPKNNGVLIVTTSGGSGILAADECDGAGLTLSQPAPEAISRLRSRLPSRCTFGNPFDLTMSTADQFALVVEENADNPDIGGFITIFGDPVADAAQEIRKASESSKKPIIVVYFGGGEVEKAERSKMYAMGIPVYPSPERGVRAYGALAKYSEFHRRLDSN